MAEPSYSDIDFGSFVLPNEEESNVSKIMENALEDLSSISDFFNSKEIKDYYLKGKPLKSLERIEGLLNKNTGVLGRIYSFISHNFFKFFSNNFKLFFSFLKDLNRTFYNFFFPILSKFFSPSTSDLLSRAFSNSLTSVLGILLLPSIFSFSTTLGFISTSISLIYNFYKYSFKTFYKLFIEFFDFLEDLFDKLYESIRSISSYFLKGLFALAFTFSLFGPSVASAFIDMATVVAEVIINMFVKNIPTIFQMITKIILWIINSFKKFFPIFMDNLGKSLIYLFTESLPRIIKALAGAFPVIARSIINFLIKDLKVIMTGILSLGDIIIKSLKEAFTVLLKGLTSKEMLDSLRYLAFTIFDTLYSLVSDIFDFFTKNYEEIENFFIQLLDFASDLFIKVFEGIVDFINKNMGSILNFIVDFTFKILNSFLKMTGVLIKKIFDTNFLKNLLNIIPTFLSNLISKIPDILDGIFYLFNQLLDQIVYSLPNLINSFIDMTLNVLDVLLNKLINEDLISKLLNSVALALDKLLSSIDIIINRILSNLENKSFYDKLEEIFVKLIKILYKSREIRDKFSKIYDTIKNKLVSELILSTGKSLMKYIIKELGPVGTAIEAITKPIIWAIDKVKSIINYITDSFSKIKSILSYLIDRLGIEFDLFFINLKKGFAETLSWMPGVEQKLASSAAKSLEELKKTVLSKMDESLGLAPGSNYFKETIPSEWKDIKPEYIGKASDLDKPLEIVRDFIGNQFFHFKKNIPILQELKELGQYSNYTELLDENTSYLKKYLQESGNLKYKENIFFKENLADAIRTYQGDLSKVTSDVESLRSFLLKESNNQSLKAIRSIIENIVFEKAKAELKEEKKDLKVEDFKEMLRNESQKEKAKEILRSVLNESDLLIYFKKIAVSTKETADNTKKIIQNTDPEELRRIYELTGRTFGGEEGKIIIYKEEKNKTSNTVNLGILYNKGPNLA